MMNLTQFDNLAPMEQIQILENLLLLEPQMEYELKHHFAGGIYEREMVVPAGFWFTGKIHLTEHLCKLNSGTMTIYSEHERGTYTGPCTFASKPGVKRLGFSHTECSFSNFHIVGEERDLETIEKMLVVDTMEQYLALAKEDVWRLSHQEQ
jgi:hypothetical protein